MKNALLKLGLFVALASSFSTQAVVFTCKGVVTNVYANSDSTFEVRYERSNGFDLEPVVVYPEQSYLLAPVLVAIADGKQGVEYTLVIENKSGSDTRCHDGESENALIGLSKS